jgi:hypothetical protein
MKKAITKSFELLILLNCLSASQAADWGEFIWGIAKTLYGGYYGSTTVRPAFALGYWRLDSWGTYDQVSYNKPLENNTKRLDGGLLLFIHLRRHRQSELFQH